MGTVLKWIGGIFVALVVIGVMSSPAAQDDSVSKSGDSADKVDLKHTMHVAKTTFYFFELLKENYSKQYIKYIKREARIMSRRKDGDYNTVFVYFLRKGTYSSRI